MNTTIYAYIEYKRSQRDYMEVFTEPIIPQSYILFCLLAGVGKDWVKEKCSKDIRAIYLPRGVPKDIDEDLLKDCFGEGYMCWDNDINDWIVNPAWHSASYLSLEELTNVVTQYQKITGGECYICQAILAAMEKLYKSRFVFWFKD